MLQYTDYTERREQEKVEQREVDVKGSEVKRGGREKRERERG